MNRHTASLTCVSRPSIRIRKEVTPQRRLPRTFRRKRHFRYISKGAEEPKPTHPKTLTTFIYVTANNITVWFSLLPLVSNTKNPKTFLALALEVVPNKPIRIIALIFVKNVKGKKDSEQPPTTEGYAAIFLVDGHINSVNIRADSYYLETINTYVYRYSSPVFYRLSVKDTAMTFYSGCRWQPFSRKNKPPSRSAVVKGHFTFPAAIILDTDKLPIFMLTMVVSWDTTTVVSLVVT